MQRILPGSAPSRRGTMLLLIGMMFVIFLVMNDFAVDVSSMQLTRSQLRAAADGTGKAGVGTHSEMFIRDVAINIASHNTISGKPFYITGVMLGAPNMCAGFAEALSMTLADKTKPLAKKSIARSPWIGLN